MKQIKRTDQRPTCPRCRATMRPQLHSVPYDLDGETVVLEGCRVFFCHCGEKHFAVPEKAQLDNVLREVFAVAQTDATVKAIVKGGLRMRFGDLGWNVFNDGEP